LEQSHYQIRFDWGADGATAVGGDADVIVWVDALPDEPDAEIQRMPAGPTIIAADLASAPSAARWVIELRARLGKRIVTAELTAGDVRVLRSGL
jgi:2-phosphosulfolactate phosphatase